MEPRGTFELIWLGLRRRCPNCAEGAVYERFTQNPHCDVCGYRFSREHGYFLGAMIVAYAVIGAAALGLMILLSTTGVPSIIAVGLPAVGALIALPLFIPMSHTLWMALDLRFDPPRPEDFASLDTLPPLDTPGRDPD